MQFCLLLFSSCNIINPAEPTPAYIHINSISVYTDSVTQGSSASKIADAWISINGQDMGVYELPATFPVIGEGTHTISIRGGIIVNGIAATRQPYPFYTIIDTSLKLSPGKTITLQPSITYETRTQFGVKENFEGSGNSIIRTINSDTTINIVENSNSFEGKSCAVYLDSNHPYFECYSIDSSVNLPFGGAPVYMELNYKCSNEFTVGLITYRNTEIYQDALLTLKATDVWKKVYVNLTSDVNLTPNATGYRIFINGSKNTGNTTDELYFDNIKLVY